MRLPALRLSAAALVLLSALPAKAQTVGISAAVNQSARGIRPGASVRSIVLGDNVIYNERIETDRIGLLQILLADGTTFTVGPNSALSIDRFVYDPNAGTAEVSATLTKGVFRFIGGRTSKTPGGVSLDTPVGTIGIRGAMADMEISSEGAGAVEAHFDLKYGSELVLTAPDGTQERVYEAGYSVVVTRNADGSVTRQVIRTPAQFTESTQRSLKGERGTSGGSPNQPTSATVVASGMATENSDRPPIVNERAIPTARPSDGDTIGTPEQADIAQDSSTDVTRGIIVAEVAKIADGGTADVVPTPRPDPTPLPTPLPLPSTSVSLALLTAGASYPLNSGGSISNPGAVGLIGGSAEEDRLVTLDVPGGTARGTGGTNRGDLVLPVYSDDAFTVRSIPLDGQTSLGGVALAGTVYFGVGGFAAYTLGLDADPARPVYALTGTPLADSSVLTTGDLRTYSFTRDPLQAIAVPFMRADALGEDYSQASISDVYVLEGDGDGASSLLLQSWLLIEGTGASQKSGIGVNVGELLADGTGALQFDFGRRGSFRPNSLDFSSEVGGTVSTAAGPAGGHELFGPNGQYLVLAGDPQANDFFADADAYQTSTERFSTAHVLNLESESPEAQFLSDRGNGQSLASGGGRTINGYATGLIEVGKSDGSYSQVLGNNDAGGSQFFIQFDDASNTLGGEIRIADNAQTNTLNVAFGNGTGGNTANGRSAYVDDDLFAAANNNNRNRNTLTQTNGSTTTTYRQVQDANPRTYLVSGDANPIPNFIPNGKLCDCTFLEWGWWGTQITASNASDPNNVRAGVHLGTWVAGDVTTDGQLAPLAGLTATYTGRAVGNVSVPVTGGRQNYVATGAMSMTYDFGRGDGTMSITDFDSRDFSGAVLATTGSTTQAEGVYGTLTQTNLGQDAQGSINGLFVNDGPTPAAGIIGEIVLATPSQDWAAVGIVAGARP